MIKTIAHLADIHIRKLHRFVEYRQVFKNLYKQLKELKPDADKVKEIIEERAKNYKDPQQVINYFYSDDEQLRNIESISLEEQVVDALLSEAKSTEENISYEDCVSGTYG